MNPSTWKEIHLAIWKDVIAERQRQTIKHGLNKLPDGTQPDLWPILDQIRALVEAKTERGEHTFAEVLAEEFLEVITEADPARLDCELIQLTAVCVAWLERLRASKTGNGLLWRA